MVPQLRYIWAETLMINKDFTSFHIARAPMNACIISYAYVLRYMKSYRLYQLTTKMIAEEMYANYLFWWDLVVVGLCSYGNAPY